MKKLLSLAMIMSLFIATTAYANETALKKRVATAISANMASRGNEVNVNIDILKKLDKPAGYYFIKLTFYDKKSPKTSVGEQYMFTNGDVLVDDFIPIDSFNSLSRELQFDISTVDIDLKNLTPAIGSHSAKNVFVKITDFQCSYCSQLNTYLHKKLKNRKDSVLYIMHLPIRSIHPRAETLAKVFEAGMMMKKNFVNDLYSPSNANLSDVEIIDKYAKRSGNATKFKKLVASKKVSKKIADSEKLAMELGISSTPILFVNGKKISGFDKPLIDKAIKNLK